MRKIWDISSNLNPTIGQCELDKVTILSLQPFITQRRQDGVKNRTINHGLQIARRILNLACKEWVDESSLTWLSAAPKIKLLPQNDERKPYSLSWEEQDRLFALLPPYLRRMALFKVNTGLRDQEVCQLVGLGTPDSRVKHQCLYHPQRLL